MLRDGVESVHLFLFYTLAAKATATTTSVIATKRGRRCPNCGTNKSGKLTCCARGGSWFRKCGNPGDPNFEYTWNDGYSSCKSEFVDNREVCNVLKN